MRLLADENFLGAAVDLLRQHGHDVAWVRTDSPGADDQDIVSRAVAEQRVLVTFDKDFGYLAFRLGVPASCGIVLFRISPGSPENVAHTALTVLESRTDWAGNFSVVEETRVRMAPLP